MRYSDEIDAMIDELEKHGATVKEVVTGGRHGKVVFDYNGREQFMTAALSGSDWRGPMNARTDVRHMLGVVGGKRVGKRRQRKNVAAPKAAEAPEALTPGRDPFAAIRNSPIYKAALAIGAERAWAQWFGLHLRTNGHYPITKSMQP